ncbi:MAG: hypothetical protein AAF570_24875, partial [Bacteroidota bacterium]
MKRVLEIGNEQHGIIIAYITFVYMYGGMNLATLGDGYLTDFVMPEEYTAVRSSTYMSDSYLGRTGPEFHKPVDPRSASAKAAIRRLIRHFVPEYAELSDEDPQLMAMMDAIFSRASQQSKQDLDASINRQVEESTVSISKRISSLKTYFEDIRIKQLRQMVETYSGPDRENIEQLYREWGEIYAMLLVESQKWSTEEPNLSNLSNYGFGPRYMEKDTSEIMQKINLLALQLYVSIPTGSTALAIEENLKDRQAMLADSPYGYHELNDFEKKDLEKVQASLSAPGPFRYWTLLDHLFDALYTKLQWSNHLPQGTRDRLESDDLQAAHLKLLEEVEYYYEDVQPIPNYMYINSNYQEELERAHLSHINRSSGFAIPLFSAKKSDGKGRCLIIFSRPDKYNVIEKSRLKDSIITAEDRNLLPPGTFHFQLYGTWYEMESDEDWQ